jgi:DNA-binding transcriptional ArsR family regulator
MSDETDTHALAQNSKRAAAFLKIMANDKRLLILCLLAQREHSVSDLEGELGIRQPTLSQQLAILREQGLVGTRRQGKSVFYVLASPEVEAVMELLYRLFCEDGAPRARGDGELREAVGALEP